MPRPPLPRRGLGLQLGRQYRESGLGVAPRQLELRARLRLQGRDLGRMGGISLLAHRGDTHREVRFEPHAPRLGVVELGSHCREHGIVLLHRLDERLRRFRLGRPHPCLELRSRLRLQCRDLRRMEGVGLLAHRGDTHREVVLELGAPRFDVFELGSRRRERRIVLPRHVGRHAFRGGELRAGFCPELCLACSECGVGLVAYGGDSRREVRFEPHAPRLGIFELSLQRRERRIVLLRHVGRHALRGVLRRAHRRLDLGDGSCLQLGRQYRQRRFRVPSGGLQLLGRLRLQRLNVGRVRGVDLPAHGGDSAREGLFELKAPRFGVFELGLQRRLFAQAPAGYADELAETQAGAPGWHRLVIWRRHAQNGIEGRQFRADAQLACWHDVRYLGLEPGWIGFGRSCLGLDRSTHIEVIGRLPPTRAGVSGSVLGRRRRCHPSAVLSIRSVPRDEIQDRRD